MKSTVYTLLKGLYKFCECGCKILIPIVDNGYRLRRFKHGHNTFGVRNSHINYKNGICVHTNGYLQIQRKHHPFAHFNGYVFLHRYRMELMLGRYLKPTELIHHIDGNKKNNEESNLMLLSSIAEHAKFNIKDRSNTICAICNSKEAIHWLKYKSNTYICNKCYCKNRRNDAKRKRSI